MSVSDARLTECHTEHGLLIAFGEFARHTGLIAGLMRVRIPQKIQRHPGTVPPQAKLVELYAGLLTGMEYLQDLNLGPHPLVKDPAVVEAWEQRRFVHYSNVSRTMEACDEITVKDLRVVIERFNQPFITEAIHDELRAGREIVFDLDLMGQSVSSTSQTYPDVAFGWMDNEVRLGYQLARVCVQTIRYGRIWLDGFPHLGATVSVNCLKELVLAAEQRAGVRPRRRSELVTQRIKDLQPTLQRLEEVCRRQTAVVTDLQVKQTEWLGQRYALEQQLKKTTNPARKVRVSKQISILGKHLTQVPTQLDHRQAVLTRSRERWQKALAEQAHWQAWRTQLEEENLQNP